MKVGEAGEAFFIFETAGDIPDDLITSPLLTAVSSPNIEPQDQDGDSPGGRFGAHSPGAEDQTPSQAQFPDIQGAVEPDFLDLNASESQIVSGPASGLSLSKPEDEVNSESSLLERTAGVGAAVMHSVVDTERDNRRRVKEKAKRITKNVKMTSGNEGDEAFSESPTEEGPEPIYNPGTKRLA